MKPGTIITDIEGLDLGPEGAVVVQLSGDEVELARLDTKEFLTVQLDELDYHAEEAPSGEGFTPSGYDESALDSPELHTIRNQPNWWGPRDPNNPSPLTDVSYRPEPIWRRQQHRHYSTQEDIRMTYSKRPQRRVAYLPPSQISVTEDEFGTLYVISGVEFTGDLVTDVTTLMVDPELDEWLYGELETGASITDELGEVVYGGADVQDVLSPLGSVPPRDSFASVRRTSRRTANPMPWMDPVPRSTAPQQPLQRDYGLPRRMELHRWEASKDDAFDIEVLVAHTLDFWKQYRAKRYQRMSSSSSGRNLDLRNWGVMYMGRAGLERDEMELLYRFMVATTLIPEKEYLNFQNMMDANSVFTYSRGSE